MRAFWNAVLRDYAPNDAGLNVLQAACEAFDAAQAAREAVAADGLTVRDRFGQVRVHPLLAAWAPEDRRIDPVYARPDEWWEQVAGHPRNLTHCPGSLEVGTDAGGLRARC